MLLCLQSIALNSQLLRSASTVAQLHYFIKERRSPTKQWLFSPAYNDCFLFFTPFSRPCRRSWVAEGAAGIFSIRRCKDTPKSPAEQIRGIVARKKLLKKQPCFVNKCLFIDNQWVIGPLHSHVLTAKSERTVEQFSVSVCEQAFNNYIYIIINPKFTLAQKNFSTVRSPHDP